MTKDEIMNMPAGREMDTLIAKSIFGNVKKSWDWEFTLPSYSTDISAAWRVVEKMSDAGSIFSVFISQSYTSDGWGVTIENAFVRYDVVAGTAPLAICRAALLAVMSEEK